MKSESDTNFMILIKFGLFEAEDKKRPVFILACHVMVNSVFLRPKLLNFKVLNLACHVMVNLVFSRPKLLNAKS